MCLIAKVGADGVPIAHPSIFLSQQCGQLLLQANVADLEENDGSLEVEVTIVAPLAQLPQARD
jgi:hypothetical protein